MLEHKPLVAPGYFYKKLEKRELYTPDFDKLRFYHSMVVFLYDDLKLGFELSHYIQGSNSMGKALTIQDSFEMKRMPAPRPVVFQKKVSSDSTARVRGEAYVCDVKHIAILDEFYKNGKEYDRIPVRIWIEDLKNESDEWMKFSYFKAYPYCIAFMYVGVHATWDKRMLIPSTRRTSGILDRDLLKDKNFFEWTWMDEDRDRELQFETRWNNSVLSHREYPVG